MVVLHRAVYADKASWRSCQDRRARRRSARRRGETGRLLRWRKGRAECWRRAGRSLFLVQVWWKPARGGRGFEMRTSVDIERVSHSVARRDTRPTMARPRR